MKLLTRYVSLHFVDVLLIDQVNFIPETVEPIAATIIDQVLKDKMYNEALVQKWIDEICSRITKDLVDMNKPFKYLGLSASDCFVVVFLIFLWLVSCAIMQKNGAGLHSAYSCFWDRTLDNTVIVKWPSEKKKDPNARVVCIVTIFGVAY